MKFSSVEKKSSGALLGQYAPAVLMLGRTSPSLGRRLSHPSRISVPSSRAPESIWDRNLVSKLKSSFATRSSFQQPEPLHVHAQCQHYLHAITATA